MTEKEKEFLQHQIDVITHFKNGGKVLLKHKANNKYHNQITGKKLVYFNFDLFDYKIVDEKWTFENSSHLIGKVIKSKDYKLIFLITRTSEFGVMASDSPYSYEELTQEFTYLDGSEILPA